MQIDVSKIVTNKPEEVVITGNEDWLSEIYALFPTVKGQEQPKITGKMSIARHEMNILSVKGYVEYMPFVDCSRCAIPISWSISESIEAYGAVGKSPGLQTDEEDEDDISGSDDITDYLQENFLNLELIVNEAIQLAIPLRTVPKSENDICQICFKAVGSEAVYCSNDNFSENPFKVLKNLKPNE